MALHPLSLGSGQYLAALPTKCSDLIWSSQEIAEQLSRSHFALGSSWEPRHAARPVVTSVGLTHSGFISPELHKRLSKRHY